MNKLIVIIEANRFVSDETIMEAVNRYKRLTGKYPTRDARMYELNRADTDDIEYSVDDDGSLTTSNGTTGRKIQ